MADINTFPGTGALKHHPDPDKEALKMEPGLDTGSSTNGDPVAAGLLPLDPKLDRRLTWKRDVLLIPVLGLMYLVLFLDRTNIANARIEGLEEGLDMPSNGYNTALWIFYIPFILAEVPSNLFLNMGKVRPNLFLGGQMFLLGKFTPVPSTKSWGGRLWSDTGEKASSACARA
jgi:hypothetical protein